MVIITDLPQISREGGDVWHVMQRSAVGYKGFGETYISWVEPGVIKGWKCHTKMVLNLVVPVGEVQFVFLKENGQSFATETIGEARYARITVPPNIWFAFQGLSEQRSMVLNHANIEHGTEVVLEKHLSEIKYPWRVI